MFLMGHESNQEDGTGVTVILAPDGAIGGVSVRGAAPGTRETDLLRPGNTVQEAHAVVLTGGSAFGLEACNGVMAYLHEQGHGFKAGCFNVPIVAGAVLFDLGYKNFAYPDKSMGYKAAQNAGPISLQSGSIGVGTGATIGKILGPELAGKGGLGMATTQIGDAYITAVIGVNAIGDIYEGEQKIAGIQHEKSVMELLLQNAKTVPLSGQNTTIGCVLTNAVLSKEEANRLADIAHDGLALAIRPVHTMMDGDTMFALSESTTQIEFLTLQAACVETVRHAVINAVK